MYTFAIICLNVEASDFKIIWTKKNKHDDESQQFHPFSSHLMKKTLKQLISGLLIFSLRGNWYGFTLDLGEQGLVDPKQKEPRKKGPLVGWVIYYTEIPPSYIGIIS